MMELNLKMERAVEDWGSEGMVEMLRDSYLLNEMEKDKKSMFGKIYLKGQKLRLNQLKVEVEDFYNSDEVIRLTYGNYRVNFEGILLPKAIRVHAYSQY